MMDQFVYNGISSREFGVIINEHTGFIAPERDCEVIEIPGMNGDLTLDNGRYKNVRLTYKCGISHNFVGQISALKGWLYSIIGYHRLEDTFEPDYFRMARVADTMEPTTYARARAGQFDIQFDCKPQRFLKSGEEVQTFTAAGKIINPTHYNALPLLRVYGTGSFGIGSTTITINTADTYTDIDCDIQDAYKGATNCNGKITLNSGNFPVLKPGENGISLTGITKIELTPRWWTI